ncbi:hypothetical protein BU26DRAFT_437074 [Trematosphaeria pertusa]|uniref:CID domain-containing protein n=1 Tax=Trematosphaeria pertusa TaxID=390896 RepID=A0A6A6HZW4_9PLEO|nr:uncharacterized protein BU26DRAFT_437074 [Trematosphaeria pertusa]KAF2243262.1 hypothetical protein BU26DRAFT_437074 [Trematosphaeria pertusa]
MSLPSAEVAADFRDALQDLKINSRPEISNLTIIAKENTEHAQAISLELENHIRTTRPEWKLPALYVLDSIVKNVGTPYTVYLGRNLYRTFMDAYLVMDQHTRKAMEGLLKTWKQPVPESMDPRPVFSHEVTGDIENALNKIRSVQAAQQAPSQRPMHALPPRPATAAIWRNTPTPPQSGARYAAPHDPRVRAPYPPAAQYGQYPSPVSQTNQFGPPQPYAQPMSSNDLEDLKAEVAKLISTTQQAFAYNPSDAALQTKLQALLALKKVLETQTLPPQQLEAVRKQVQNLAPIPAPTPMPAFAPLASVPPPVMHTPQQPMQSNFPPPASAPIDIGQLLASMRPAATPIAATPQPPSTPNLADLLRRVSSPAQSSTPATAPFYPSPFSAPPSISTPVQAPAIPTPAPAPAATPTQNLAQILAQFTKPGAAPSAPAPRPAPSQFTPLAQLLSQPPAQAPPTAPAPGSAEWLLNALKGLPTTGTPSNTTPVASEPMTRQSSAPTNVLNEIELTTASMKKPRLHLISRLYEAFPNICATCGRRFESTPQGKEKKARHMDWHFKVKDPDAAKRGVHRSWYISEKEWIEYREVDETSPEQPANGASAGAAAVKKQAKDRYVPVPQDAAIAHAPCPICQEKFEPQWLVEANDFVWMDAIQVGGKIYHATCWEEYSKGAGIATPSTPDSVLGKRKAEVSTPTSGKKVRAY